MKYYEEITAYIPSLEDHATRFCYYGQPMEDGDTEYAVEDEHGNPLVMSAECTEFCETIGGDLAEDTDWQKVFEKRNIKAEEVFSIEPETADEELTRAVLLELADSLSENDQFIEALQNGFLLKMLKRLQKINEELERENKV